MRALGVTDNTVLKNLDEVVKKDIDNIYQDANQALSAAQKNMDASTKTEIENLMRGLRDTTKVPRDLNDLIESKNLSELVRIRKNIFDQDIDRVYSKITDKFKESNIIPTSMLKAELKEVSK
jgi:alcohol dehydrogenase class IV